MNTAAFSIIVCPKASKSNENLWTLNTFAPKGSKAMNINSFSMLVLPKASKNNEHQQLSDTLSLRDRL